METFDKNFTHKGIDFKVKPGNPVTVHEPDVAKSGFNERNDIYAKGDLKTSKEVFHRALHDAKERREAKRATLALSPMSGNKAA